MTLTISSRDYGLLSKNVVLALCFNTCAVDCDKRLNQLHDGMMISMMCFPQTGMI